MYCSQCGKKLADGEVCACKQQARQPAPQQAPQTAMNVLKRTLSSGLFLAMVILFSVFVVFNVINAMTPTDYTDLIAELEIILEVDLSDFTDEFLAYAEPDPFASFLGALIGSAPYILISIGLWLLYISAKSKETATIHTKGLTLTKVGTIIQFSVLLFVIVVAVLVCIAVMVFVSSGNNGFAYGDYQYTLDDPNIVAVVCLFLMLILAGIAVFYVILLLKALKTIKSVKQVATTGLPDDKISMFLIVILYIEGVSSGISAIESLAFNGLGALSTLGLAVGTFFVAFTLNAYKREMKGLCGKINAGMASVYQASIQPQATPQAEEPLQPVQPQTITYISCEQCGQQYSSSLEKCPKCGASNFIQK